MFTDPEFLIPLEAFRAAGCDVAIIGSSPGDTVKGEQGFLSVMIDKGIDEVSPDEYDELFIPGGHSPDYLRADHRFVAFVKQFDDTGKPIAAVSYGPQLLASAKLVKGRTLTAWPTIQNDLAQMGATVRDEAVVTDKNWITSRTPDDLLKFSEAAVRALR